jgi:two-component sensor histidine kinase
MMSGVNGRLGSRDVLLFNSVQHALQRTWRALSLARFMAVILICVILSTQILFQPGLFDHWSIEQILEGWTYYVAEILFTGIAMLGGFAFAEGMTTSDGVTRIVALAIALSTSAALGYGLAIVVLYDPGFAPAPAQFIGDTLRLATVGGAAALVCILRERALRAAQTMHATEVARQALAKQMLEARLQLMEAQIEPHFLFNTLANIQRLYETDGTSGEQLIQNFKVYLRAALPKMREAQSTLAREVDLASAYLEVLRARMGERLGVTINLPAELRERSFPPMMLITLVENAIKHGIHPSTHGGVVSVSARDNEGRLTVEVADTGVGFQGKSGKGVGLSNIRARLSILFGQRAELILAANEPSGVVATIAIPAA